MGCGGSHDSIPSLNIFFERAKKPDFEKYTVWYIFALVTKAERTKQQILEATAPLFNMKGFDGTTLADLCEATQLTKGALYGNFENKEDLAVAAFQYASKRVKSMVASAVDVHVTYKARLLAMLTFFSDYVFNPPLPGGCPLLNTAIEADDYHTSLRQAVAAELESTIRFMTNLIDRGKRAGEFRTDIKSREYAFLFFCSVEGALMFARVSPTDEAMRLVVKQCKQIIDQISNN
jgi:TetR/AcrR family transcriptional regulator, transcriptional repressor for nem operon